MPKEKGKSANIYQTRGFSGGSDGKEPACNAGDHGLTPDQEDPLVQVSADTREVILLLKRAV